MGSHWQAVTRWSARRWVVAGAGALATALLVALPTAVIPNPVFGRSVAVTWWSYPTVVVTAVLAGLLLATYVRQGEAPDVTVADDEIDRTAKLGMAGTLITFFAVGCPVCNKLVLVALGASGAIAWFAPIQPFLALASIVLMVVALRQRLKGEVACPVSIPGTPTSST